MPHRPRLLKQLAARGLLALAFLFAQQTAALHWLAHAVEATQSGAAKSAPPTHHCDDCLALGALGAAAPAGESTAPPVAPAPVAVASLHDASRIDALRLAFRSRAPPIPT